MDGDIAAGLLAGAIDNTGNSNFYAKIDLNLNNGLQIVAQTSNAQNGQGILALKNGTVDVNTVQGNVNIEASKSMYVKDNLIKDDIVKDANYENSKVYGAYTENGIVDLNSENGNIVIKSYIDETVGLGLEGYDDNIGNLRKGNIYGIGNSEGTIDLSAKGNTDGVGTIQIEANAHTGNAYGLDSWQAVKNNLQADKVISISAISETGNAYAVKVDTDNREAGRNNKFESAYNKFTANSASGEAYAIKAENGTKIDVISTADDNTIGNWFESNKTAVKLTEGSVLNATGNTVIKGAENGLVVVGNGGNGISTMAEGDEEEYQVTVNGDLYAYAENGTAITLTNTKTTVNGNEIIYGENGLEINNAVEYIEGSLSGIATDTAVKITGSNLTIGGNIGVEGGNYGVIAENSTVSVKNENSYGVNYIAGGKKAVSATDSTISLDSGADGRNILISTNNNALYAVDSTITVSGGRNTIMTGEKGSGANAIYTGTAVNATNDKNDNAGENGSTVNILGNENFIGGTVRANGGDTVVNIGGSLAEGKLTGGANNYIVSSALGVKGSSNANVSAAVYAQNGANVNIKAGAGQSNIIISDVESLENASNYDERAIWAQGGSQVNIEGQTIIAASKSERIGIDENGNPVNINFDELTENTGLGIAIAAGTGEISGESTLPKVPAGVSNSSVNLNYSGNSAVYGDIISAWNGLVNIKSDNNSGSKLNVYGSALAGNGGVLNLDLGNGGVWYGRADDYGDAGAYNDSTNEYEGFYDPAFSNKILEGGTVNLTMGEDSTWYVQGQSWITSIDTGETENTVIDLVSANTDRNTTAHALTIGTLTGDTTFKINLDQERANSDMLYIKNANGNYEVNVVDAITTENMYAGGFDGLRFATIGAGSNATFSAYTRDAGAFNVNYLVRTEDYSADDWQNDHYNGVGENDGAASIEKPGNDSVNDFFGETESGGEAETNGIKLMAETENEAAAKVDNTNNQTTNIVLYGRIDDGLSDAGKTMLNMSRANYSNAIYMDRLNKRLGEARYINSEDGEGMWVRIRHDRIGKTDAYRSQNTMYELGYDVKQECDNGERRVGMAIDYMHGDTGYSDIAGKGEIDRYGLWLYDTWMGDKGHYADYVVKWGHLSNDFELYTMSEHEKVTGDYSNNVFSVSAEYGKKNDMGNGWYIEPQVQAQLARVTGADYVTSQDTKVSVDGINSLIGRAGFRLGKDFGEEKQSTVYIKADVLHEFLGDQDISVMDNTTNGEWASISYENEGTWYDVGFGFATAVGKNSYAFMDFEKSFGHDNDETYQINAGVQWTF